MTGPVPSDTIETDRKSPGPGVDGPLDGAGLADQILGKNISDFKAGNKMKWQKQRTTMQGSRSIRQLLHAHAEVNAFSLSYPTCTIAGIKRQFPLIVVVGPGMAFLGSNILKLEPQQVVLCQFVSK